MFDILIRGGNVVTPEGVGQLDLGLQGERLVAIAAPGMLTADSARTIDATGMVVMPGGIDAHHHTRHGVVPGRERGALSIIGAGPAGASRAALYGGITTIVDFATWGITPEGSPAPDMSIAEAIANQEAFWCEAYCDYSLHVHLRGAVSAKVIEQIPEAIGAGFPSIKVYTTEGRPNRSGRKVDMGRIWAIMEQLSRHGGILMVHAEDDEVLNYMHERLEREGRIGFENVHLVHSVLSEDLSFRRVIRAARNVEGAALYMAHVSAGVGVDAIAEARADGYPVYGETLPNYVTFTAEDYLRPDGALYHTFPSLKHREDRERLWSGLIQGSINFVATDEVCTPRAYKLRGNTIFDVVGGYVGVETLLPILYTEGVSKRGLSLERFVALISTNPARILGLYPRKGVLAVGSDADVTIFDPTVRKVLHARDLHESDYTLWEGWEVHGWPVMTLLRGKVVVEGGQFRGQPGDARRVPRKIDPAVLSGPMVV